MTPSGCEGWGRGWGRAGSTPLRIQRGHPLVPWRLDFFCHPTPHIRVNFPKQTRLCHGGIEALPGSHPPEPTLLHWHRLPIQAESAQHGSWIHLPRAPSGSGLSVGVLLWPQPKCALLPRLEAFAPLFPSAGMLSSPIGFLVNSYLALRSCLLQEVF